MLISFIGTEKCDLLFALAKVGISSGKKILIIDNSVTGDFYNIYNKDGEDIIDYNSMTIARLFEYDESKVKNYDYIYLYEGLKPTYLGSRDLTIANIGVAPSDLKMVSHEFNSKVFNENPHLILIRRDYDISKKIKEEYYARAFGWMCRNSFKIKFIETDYRVYYTLCINRDIKLTAFSNDFLDSVYTLSQTIYGYSEKQAANLIQRS